MSEFLHKTLSQLRTVGALELPKILLRGVLPTFWHHHVLRHIGGQEGHPTAALMIPAVKAAQ